MAEKEADPLVASADSHKLADHTLGWDLIHSHQPGVDHDHDHDDFGDPVPLEENPIWLQDHVSLRSVGIDIGSSGTQVIFSLIKLRRLGEDLSSRYFVVSRETLFQSPVAFTPYESEVRIDQRALGTIIDEAYNAASITPEDIDTGAVILTGEALRRQNAEAIAEILAGKGGDFVCAAAGHHMEAMLAAFGSGAAHISAEEGKRILNVDIGGGTTKLAIVEDGKVVATAAFHVGGRLQVVECDGRISRLDPAGQRLASRAGFSWGLGDFIDVGALDELALSMADAVITSVVASDLPADIEALQLTERLPEMGRIDGVMFSGGVAEYLYGNETRDFKDLGRRLGLALRQKIEAGALPWPLLQAQACIRATALGASEYSIQLSGNTIYVSNNRALLPRRNLQVVKPGYHFPDAIAPNDVARSIRAHLTLFDLADEEREIALAFQWRGAPSFPRILAFARGIVAALPRTIAQKRPIYLVLDGDLAQTLGGVLREDLGVQSEILVVDGIVLVDFDYIDLGKIRLPSHTVPVTVKSLLFNAAPGGFAVPHLDGHGHGHRDQHPHHHGRGHGDYGHRHHHQSHD